MEEITEIQTLVSKYSFDLDRTLRERIKEGWQPYGQLVITDRIFEDQRFYQQIVKRK